MYKVLIADDNTAITDILKLNFQLLGYVVRVANNGEDAEKQFHSFKPDIMILDVMMPRKDGFQVCRNLKADPECAATPIILLTAKTLPEDVRAGFDCNANAYVTKPYNPKDLEVLVAQLLEEVKSGKRSVAWTGLPDAGKVEEDFRQRLEAGGDAALVELLFLPHTAETFIQRYGNPRFRDFLHRIAWQMRDRAMEVDSSILMGQSIDDTFVFCCASSKLEALKKACEEELNRQTKETVAEAEKALESTLGTTSTAIKAEEKNASPVNMAFMWRSRVATPTPE